jgi:uncharacterized protein (TIGR03086 family)
VPPISEDIHDPLDQLQRSLAAVESLIKAILPEQWSAQTPCEEWEVGRVVEHLVGMNHVFAAILVGEPPPQDRENLRCDAAPQLFRDSAITLLDRFAQPGALDRSYAGPLGSATGSDRLRIRLYDLLAHGWDIAIATGQPVQLPVDAAKDSLVFAREQISDDARAGRFGPSQPTVDSASAIDQLVAFLGRRIG